MSAPVPSLTAPGCEGAVVSDLCPLEFAAPDCSPAPFSATTVK